MGSIRILSWVPLPHVLGPHMALPSTAMQRTHNRLWLFHGLKPRLKHLRAWPTSLRDANTPEAQSVLPAALPSGACPLLDLSIKIHNSVVPATRTARNLGLTLGDLLSFAANSAVISYSCRFILYNIRRTYQFLSQKATGLSAQALIILCLDDCHSFLAGPPARVMKPLATAGYSKPIQVFCSCFPC